ncbi:uncharacterized protein [Centruroides vittatus]|uniref:uncharacterized protein n=1 Tax=Centruroides vittatus TaxID=120091 RepID=UPI00350ED27E
MADPSTNLSFLVDTGADVSVIPKSLSPQARNPGKLVLFAANGTRISTYGTKLLTLDFNLQRSFPWPFIIADVTQPIIGIDFLTHFDLLVDARQNRLIDASMQFKSRGTERPKPTVNLTITTVHGDSEFQRLLAEFPSITNPSLVAARSNKASIFHHIGTTGPPVFCRPRRLLSGQAQSCQGRV